MSRKYESESWYNRNQGSLFAFSPVIIVALVMILILISPSPRSSDQSNFDNAKNDCVKLKQYVLDSYGMWNYDEAKDRYSVMCK